MARAPRLLRGGTLPEEADPLRDGIGGTGRVYGGPGMTTGRGHYFAAIQLTPTPTSATSGTRNRIARSISSRTTVAIA